MMKSIQLTVLIDLTLLALFVQCYIVPDEYDTRYNEFNDLKVQTDSGIVQGEIKSGSARSNFQIRQFIGIPYAQKPIDIYRFSVSALIVFAEIDYFVCVLINTV